MPRSSVRPVEHLVADATAFDFSEIDEDDIGDTAFAAFAACEAQRATPDHDRADRADDVLVFCALLVFKDRRRKIRRGTMPPALPGL
jgi:hypothetical protein